jgi:hypothetical protein
MGYGKGQGSTTLVRGLCDFKTNYGKVFEPERE